MSRCPCCQFDNEPGAIVCKECQSSLDGKAACQETLEQLRPDEAAGDLEQETVQAYATHSSGQSKVRDGDRPRLIVIRGERPNIEYALYEGDNYIGRTDDKAVDINLENQEPHERIWASRQHAVISFEGGMLHIEDLNSTNGTYVNRKRIEAGCKTPLKIGDIVQIGTVQMRVKL